MKLLKINSFRTTVDFDRENLWNESSNWQAENDVTNYDFSTFNEDKLGELWSTYEKVTLTFIYIIGFVRLWRYTFMQNVIKCNGSWVIVLRNFLALSRNSKKSENPVLCPWPLTYDLELFWISSGCQGTCSCEISSSWLQRFVSHRANKEKTRTKTIQSVATARTVIMMATLLALWAS